jgi:hypothetical protein
MKTLWKVGMGIALGTLTASFTFAGVNQWTVVGAKPPGLLLYALLVDPHTPTVLYAQVDGSFFKSTTAGVSWSAAPIINASSLAADPLRPMTLYAGVSDIAAARVRKSTDGGQTWVDVRAEPFDDVSVLIDPLTKETLYVEFSSRRKVGFAQFEIRKKLLKSVDGGTTWVLVSESFGDETPFLFPVATCPTNPAIRYGMYVPTGFLTRSVDGGVSWPGFDSGSFFAGSAVFDPHNPAIVYMNGFLNVGQSLTHEEESPFIQAVLRSTDCGESWTSVGGSLESLGIRDFSPLAISPGPSSTLYLGGVSEVWEFRPVNPSPEVLAWFEGPDDEQTVAGIGPVRGWAFVTRPGVFIRNGELRIDDGSPESIPFIASIPCCVERDDVQAAFPQFPAENTLKSGWGTAYSWGRLDAGAHKIQVSVRSTAGDIFIAAPRTVTVVKPGDLGFLEELQIAGAQVEIVGEELVVNEMIAREGNTRKRINVRYRWLTNSQTLGAVHVETVATLSSWISSLSFVTALLSSPWQYGLMDASSAHAAGGVISNFESPIEGQKAAGMSVIRGWGFPEDPLATLRKVRFAIDGRHIGTISCCSAREDVAGVYNTDRANAWFSGWSIPINYSEQEPGRHTLTVQLEASNGITQTLTRNVETLRLGGFPFLDQFILTGTTARIEGEEIVLSGVQVRDKASQQTKVIEVRLRWFEHTQALGIVAAN